MMIDAWKIMSLIWIDNGLCMRVMMIVFDSVFYIVIFIFFTVRVDSNWIVIVGILIEVLSLGDFRSGVINLKLKFFYVLVKFLWLFFSLLLLFCCHKIQSNHLGFWWFALFYIFFNTLNLLFLIGMWIDLQIILCNFLTYFILWRCILKIYTVENHRHVINRIFLLTRMVFNLSIGLIIIIWRTTLTLLFLW